MATRATIGYLNPSNSITTTYNHYDGYPENLGVALKNHYNTDEKAKEIANMGYVSFVDPKTGEIEANNKSRPVTVGGGDDLVSTLQYFKEQASEGDYAYLWSPSSEEWLFSPTAIKMEDFVDSFALGIDFQDEDDMADYDSIDNMEEGKSEVIAKAQIALKGKPDLDTYMSSLTNDIRLNGDGDYLDYGNDDWVEDYTEFMGDKMSMEEAFTHKMKHRAGIIK